MYSMKRTSASTLASIFDQVGQLVVVDAAQHDRIHLELRKAEAARGCNALEHLRVRVAARQRRKPFRAQRVQTQRHAVQSRRAERFALLGEQDAVGREREIANARIGGQHSNKLRQIAAQQRFAARQAHVRRRPAK